MIERTLTGRSAPFADGRWKIHVELQDQYPYKSPSIGFVNRIFHPNIDEQYVVMQKQRRNTDHTQIGLSLPGRDQPDVVTDV